MNQTFAAAAPRAINAFGSKSKRLAEQIEMDARQLTISQLQKFGCDVPAQDARDQV